MTGELLIELLQKVGFPIFVAGWFMFRHEKRMDRQAELIRKLMHAVELLARSMDEFDPLRPGAAVRLGERTKRLLTSDDGDGDDGDDGDDDLLVEPEERDTLRTSPPRIEDRER